MFSGLKDQYPKVESPWCYDAIVVNDIVLFKDDRGTKRMKTIVVINGNVHLYIIHLLSQPNIIEEPILSLEYNNVGPNEKEE